MPEICRFNTSEYGNNIGTPVLCKPRDGHVCIAANSVYYLNGALACCYKTAETLLQIGADPAFVSGVRDSIQNSTPDADNPLQIGANELKAQGITRALAEAGHPST